MRCVSIAAAAAPKPLRSESVGARLTPRHAGRCPESWRPFTFYNVYCLAFAHSNRAQEVTVHRHLLRLVSSVFCVCLLVAGVQSAGSSAVLALELQEDDVVVTLDNGLNVFISPKPGSPVATVSVWIGVGSADESAELNGIAHFFEHMIFKGSERFPDVDKTLEGWGGSSNAATSFDFTYYYVTVPHEHAAAALDLMADILQNGLFPEEELIKERDVVLREGDQRNDNPDSYMSYQMWQRYYGDHPYGQPILGTRETVSGITHADFLEWLDTHYVPSNMRVVVTGGVDADSMQGQIQNLFGGLEAKDAPSFEPPPVRSLTDIEEVFLPREVEQERLTLIWPAPSGIRDFQETVDIDVLLYVLRGGRSSRLYRNVVRDLGVITSAGASYYTTQADGIFQVYAQYPFGQTEVARAALLQEMRSVLAGNITDEEVEIAKTVLIAQTEVGAESSLGKVRHLGFFANVTDDPLTGLDYVQSLRQVTRQDVLDIARKYIDLDSYMEFRMAPEVELQAAAVEADAMLTLDNGLRLILREDPSSNVVSFQTFVGTGSGVESAAQAGISTFTNALLLRGTENRSEEEMFMEIENLGATLSQGQLPDMAQVTLTATADTWPAALPIYLEALTRPAFAEEEFQRLKRDRLLDLEALRDDHFSTISDQLLQELYGASGYGNPELGTGASIEALTLEDVKSFYTQHYVPENMLMAVVGNINADLMAARLGTALGDMQPRVEEAAEGSRAIELSEPRTAVQDHDQLNLTWLIMGFPAPSISHEDYGAMKVLNSIAGSGASSRIFTTIRDEMGLAYAAGSYFPSRRGDSYLAAYAIVLPENQEMVVEEILNLLTDIAENGVSDEELALAIDREMGDFTLRNETAQQRAFYLGWYEMLGAGPSIDTDYPQRIRSVTSEDVQRVAETYLQTYVVSILEPAAG